MIPYFLARLIHTITGKPRYFPEFEWSTNLWTHNAFRFFGMIFGEPYGIRPSVGSEHIQGKNHVIAYTLEAQLALFETAVRAFFKKKLGFKIIWIPQLQLAGFSRGGVLPYRFAIAFDASAGTGSNNTPLTQVISGSNNFLYVFEIGDTTDTLSSISFNSVLMTFAQKVQVPGDRWTYGYVQVGPSTGSHTVTVVGTTFNECGAMSYTGCAQSGQPDSVGVNSTASSGTTFSVSTTVIAANCWTSNGIDGGVWASELAGSTGRSITAHRLRDSNGIVSTGSQSLGFTNTGSGFIMAGITISIAPVVAGAITSRLPYFNLLGIGN